MFYTASTFNQGPPHISLNSCDVDSTWDFAGILNSLVYGSVKAKHSTLLLWVLGTLMFTYTCIPGVPKQPVVLVWPLQSYRCTISTRVILPVVCLPLHAFSLWNVLYIVEISLTPLTSVMEESSEFASPFWGMLQLHVHVSSVSVIWLYHWVVYINSR